MSSQSMCSHNENNWLKLKQSGKSQDFSQLFMKECWWWKLASLKHGLSGTDFCIVFLINTFKIPLILFNPFSRLFVSYQYARKHFQTLSNIYENIKFWKVLIKSTDSSCFSEPMACVQSILFFSQHCYLSKIFAKQPEALQLNNIKSVL